MEIMLLTALVFVASAIGTLTGFGLSTIMIPVVLLFYPFKQAIFFVGIIHLFGNIWKVVLFHRGFRWKLILCFGIPGIAASFLGAKLAFEVPAGLLLRILAGFMIIYVIYLFVKPSFKIKQGTGSAVTGGALSGFLAGIFGMGGAVRGLFLSSFDLPKSVYIATAGTIALFIDTTRVTSYYVEGARLEPSILWGMLIFIPASFLGAKAAKLFVDKIPQKHFRKVIAAFLFLVALKLLLFPT
ncbi:MAG: TSUP family transporter [Phycisphaerae bacterium]|nr:sulfite exporter TauE/SafE family protein [Phycisphaerae bacterium]NIP54566.1 sulfite exporter TauE/SafE family protein [Phycisphaerae bacterium]NIS53408.1 sulfite exporter TauE/SafE family protein [Phycisphaerae bacterium]NIU10899.1 sulfite exporter TauE/SafE family protein [Phycisphaerae bacterium]NIU58736.1 TSUP family transporter [Phycisphaerae bacterium]